MADLNQNISTGKGFAILGAGTAACILFFLTTGGNGCTGNKPHVYIPPPSIVGTGPAPAAGPQLEVGGDWKWERTSGGYITVEGRVKNLTQAPIDGIKAIATVKDAGGKLLRTDDALIDYRPLNPGQSSPFKVMVRLEEGSGESKASLEFAADGVQLKCK